MEFCSVNGAPLSSQLTLALVNSFSGRLGTNLGKEILLQLTIVKVPKYKNYGERRGVKREVKRCLKRLVLFVFNNDVSGWS